MISGCQWIHFIKPPGLAIVSVVWEFYANANAEGDAVVQVRGKSVVFGSQAINALLATPNYEGKDYMEPGLRSYDIEDIIKRLCKPGSAWKKNDYIGEKTSFPTSALSRFGKAWFSFICASTIPTRHLSDVTKDRAILLFAIVTGLRVGIGVLIHEPILKAIKSTVVSGLSYSSLITQLCKRAGI